MTDRRERSDTRAVVRHLVRAFHHQTEELGHLRRELLAQSARGVEVTRLSDDELMNELLRRHDQRIKSMNQIWPGRD